MSETYVEGDAESWVAYALLVVYDQNCSKALQNVRWELQDQVLRRYAWLSGAFEVRFVEIPDWGSPEVVEGAIRALLRVLVAQNGPLADAHSASVGVVAVGGDEEQAQLATDMIADSSGLSSLPIMTLGAAMTGRQTDEQEKLLDVASNLLLHMSADPLFSIPLDVLRAAVGASPDLSVTALGPSGFSVPDQESPPLKHDATRLALMPLGGSPFDADRPGSLSDAADTATTEWQQGYGWDDVHGVAGTLASNAAVPNEDVLRDGPNEPAFSRAKRTWLTRILLPRPKPISAPFVSQSGRPVIPLYVCIANDQSMIPHRRRVKKLLGEFEDKLVLEPPRQLGEVRVRFVAAAGGPSRQTPPCQPGSAGIERVPRAQTTYFDLESALSQVLDLVERDKLSYARRGTSIVEPRVLFILGDLAIVSSLSDSLLHKLNERAKTCFIHIGEKPNSSKDALAAVASLVADHPDVVSEFVERLQLTAD